MFDNRKISPKKTQLCKYASRVYHTSYLISTKVWDSLLQMWFTVHKYTNFLKIFAMLKNKNTAFKYQLAFIICVYNATCPHAG